MQSLTFRTYKSGHNGRETVEGTVWPECHQCNKQSANKVGYWVPV